MNTVVAAETFEAGRNYAVTKTGQVGRNQAVSHFFEVPAGTPAFKVDLAGGGGTAGTGQIRFLRFHPYGIGIDSNGASNCYNPPAAGCTTGSPTSRTVTDPQAGVWEVLVDARRMSDVAWADYTLTASILGASVSPDPDVLDSVTLGVPTARSYDVTNDLGAFTGRAVGSTLGSAFRGVETVADHEVKRYTVQVPEGSGSLRATIGGTSDPGADLDLFVYLGGVLKGQSADGDSEESVTIANPAAGTYTIVVDGYAVPSGSTTFDYVDVFANPALGKVEVTDANALRPSGAKWSVPASVTALAAPAAGRVLLGAVQVRTDGNVLVGSADVVVRSVSSGQGGPAEGETP